MEAPRLRCAVAALLALAGACGGEAARPPSVVLITLDTTRADHLGCYGYARDTTPRLDALAREGLLHTRARSTSSWTLPAHASLFTGRFTSSHGARFDPEGPLRLTEAVGDPEHLGAYRARPLVESETTLAELLQRRGYATAAVVAGPWMKRAFGLAQGFEHYDDAGIDDVTGRLAGDVTDAALAWADGLGQRPYFLFLNYYDPHGPYGAPAPFTFRFVEDAPGPEDPAALQAFVRQVQGQGALRIPDFYDGEIAYVDHQLGRLLDGLAVRGRLDEALVVVTADHGELLGDHERLGHGEDLYREELWVPLIVRPPGGLAAGQRSDAPVQLVDVPVLILEALGLPVPATMQGVSPGERTDPMVAELFTLPAHPRSGVWRVAETEGHKLWWSSEGDRLLYDLERDPGERQDLAAGEPQRVRALTGWLEAWAASLPPPGEVGSGEVELDEATRRALESLGYTR